jgi:hypothetical protein
VAEPRNYLAEAEALRRAEVGQLRALLLAFDIVDNAVRATSAILEPLRRIKKSPFEARFGISLEAAIADLTEAKKDNA